LRLVSHGIANIVLFFVAPDLDIEGIPAIGPQVQYAVGILSVIGVSVAGYLISRSVIAESRRRRATRATRVGRPGRTGESWR